MLQYISNRVIQNPVYLIREGIKKNSKFLGDMSSNQNNTEFQTVILIDNRDTDRDIANIYR